MNKDHKKLLCQVKTFTAKLYTEKIDPSFLFHNFRHTKNVANAAKKISGHYKLRKDDQFALIIASLFHDTGFSEGKSEGHESKSIAIAQHFLKNKIPGKVLEKVLSCIRATSMPQKPSNTIERIICDADLYHLGTYMFKMFSNRLKQEREIHFKKPIPDQEWLKSDIAFLKAHKYFTRYCQRHLEPVKQEWLQILESNNV